ncbi:MAG: hypothetical protein ACOY3D_04660 [Candidatus Omnitrophota bacterium]
MGEAGSFSRSIRFSRLNVGTPKVFRIFGGCGTRPPLFASQEDSDILATLRASPKMLKLLWLKSQFARKTSSFAFPMEQVPRAANRQELKFLPAEKKDFLKYEVV